MSEWKEYRLGDILSIKSGFSYKGKFIGTGNSLLLGMGCVSFKEKFLISGARPYSGPYDERYKVHSGDIVLATRQQSDNLPILAMPAMVPDSLQDKDIVIGTNLYKVEINDTTFSNVFIYWLLKTKQYVNYIACVKTGTTVSMVTKKNVEDFTFFAPTNPKEREEIVSIISYLDDKIAVNRKICENLEAQAQALFKHWFVDFAPFKDGNFCANREQNETCFNSAEVQPKITGKACKFIESELGMIPEGWRVGNIFDVASIYDKIRKPLSGKDREYMNKIYPYYGATSCMDYVDNYLFDGIYTLIGEDGSVVKEDGLPYMQYVWGKFWVNNHAHILQGKNGFSTEMVHVFLSIYNIKHLVTGAVQAKLSQANMQKIMLPIPPKDVINKIRPVIDSLYEKIRNCEEESSRLASLRDTLLPKLMSGELQVNEIEKSL